MGIEIERKFLLKNDSWRDLSKGTGYRQGYLCSSNEGCVRVRATEDKGYLTIKSITKGATRSEFEYDIPVTEANQMLDELCRKPLIEKKRYKIDHKGMTWEVDEFFAENDGLIIAEVELGSEDQNIQKPDWIGKEVTDDPRYFNSNLALNPFTKW